MPSRPRLLLAFLIAVQAGIVLAADETARTPAEETAPAARDAAPPTRNDGAPIGDRGTPAAIGGGAIRYLEGPNGRAVPVPAGATLEEFERWLESRNRPQPEAAPQYGITWTALEGTAEDDRTLLDATVQVQVLTEGEWIRVPLRFDEAILRSTGYAGSGESQFQAAENNGGYYCWLRGKGQHELKLSFVVPLRKTTSGRRLTLSTPKTAGGSLRLTVPIPPAQLSASVQPPDRLDLKVVRTGNGSSIIEVFGRTERLDLSWQAVPSPRQVKPVLQAKTLAVVELAGDSMLLNPVTQRIQPLRGSMSQISVRIPKRFTILRVLVDGVESSGRLKRADDSDEVVISLPEPTTGAVELRWVLEAPLQRDGELRLEGFQVRDALLQTGEIVIEPAEGLTLSQLGGREVRRTTVIGSGGGVSERGTAYRFLKQPFELVLGVREIEPYFAVTPRQLLRIGVERAELFADFEVEVFRGAIGKLELDWPMLQAEDWTLHTPENPGLIDEWKVDSSGRVAVDLLQRQTGRFRVSLRASRPITIGAEAFNLGLPVPVASNRARSVVLVARDDSVKLRLEPAEGTVLRDVPERLEEQVARLLDHPDLPDAFDDLQRAEYLIESEPHTLQVQAAVSPPQLLVDTAVRASAEPERLQVEQVIQFDVDFRRVSQIRLLVPRDLQNGLRFSLEGERAIELHPTWTETEDAAVRVVRLTLPEARIGKFDIRARFAVARPGDALPGSQANLRLPLIRSADADYGSVQFVFVPGAGVEGVVDAPEWERRIAASGPAGWVATTAAVEIPLKLRQLELHPAPQLTVEKALIRSQFGPDGSARSRAHYRVSNSAEDILLSVPPDEIVLETVWWNDQKLRVSAWGETTPGSGEYRITVPAQRSESGGDLLTVEYRSRTAFPFRWSRLHGLVAPQFAPEVWIEETLWEVTLPLGQHLFAAPQGFTPEFHWERDFLIWRRRPDARVNDVRAALGPDISVGGTMRARGNTYHFSRFGPAQRLELRSMAQSLVLLCGAGLALVASFILLKVPALRSPLTLLAAATGLAVAGLWYATPVQLLLQPAILGVLLAMAAVWIDGSLKRRRPVPLLTLSSPSDFLTPSASSSSVHRPRTAPAPVGSEDPTSLRPGRSSATAAASPSTASGHGA